MKKTKIVATLGPASSSVSMIEKMVKAGVNVCRINFSHGSYDDILPLIQNVRTVNEKLGRNIAILADLQGPKLRIGNVENDQILLVKNKELVITTKKCISSASRLYMSYTNFPKDVKKGDSVMIDDGKLLLTVISTNRKDEVKAKVEQGGILTNKKGVNLPNTKVSLPSLTKKDLEDLDFAMKQQVDWIGLSFVRSAKDIIELKAKMQQYGGTKAIGIVAKIEKPEALADIDNIIRETDALMVARGDLGVEVKMQEVPIIQKMLVEKCLKASKPVIIATHMMESMITNINPSRAEVNDVANSVMDGADAVMLSAETSVGKHPDKVVEAMAKIIEHVEENSYTYYRDVPPPINLQSDRYISNSICYTATEIAKRTNSKAIITLTHSGYTPINVASHRPQASIYVFTANREVLAMLNLVWGVKAFYFDSLATTDDTILEVIAFLKKRKYIKTKDLIVNISTIPLSEKGKSNMLKLSEVG
jgi:pyruvate kinase